ncbi:sugar-binding domain-containing protein [Verrucomicrobiota bacterium]
MIGKGCVVMRIKEYICSGLFTVALIFSILQPACLADEDRINLAGKWKFQIDPDDKGISEAWFNKELAKPINLPGSLQEQGYGNDLSTNTPWVAHIKVDKFFQAKEFDKWRKPESFGLPYFLNPKKHYIGPAWYQRSFDIPPDHFQKRYELVLERTHIATTVWLNGNKIGVQDSIASTHRYNLTSHIKVGTKNVLTIRVDNPPIIAVNRSHTITDHTQTAWNGIIGEIAVHITDQVWIKQVKVIPDIAKKTAKVIIDIGNDYEHVGTVDIAIDADSPEHDPELLTKTVTMDGIDKTVEIDYPLGEGLRLWDEFDPYLYNVSIDLSSDDDAQFYDGKIIRTGFRDIRVKDLQMTVNGRSIFLRGTLDCAIFPLTAYPPMEIAEWKRILKTYKEYGLNHVRFHSWCPPDAAFVAADELGLYLQPEMVWAVGPDGKLGIGKYLDDWVWNESERIVAEFGNHPSFTHFAVGNELASVKRGKENITRQWLEKWIEHWKNKDARRLYASASGWPSTPNSQFHIPMQPRLHRWVEGMKARLISQKPESMSDYSQYINKHPLIGHESCQFMAFPDFSIIPKINGSLRPTNYEILKHAFDISKVSDQEQDFLMAAGKLQVLCHKEEFEAALRTPNFGGTQILSIYDFTGQGTSMCGVLDGLCNPKPYVTAEEYRRFCSEIVPLARLEKYTWTSDETFAARIDLAQYGPKDLKDAVLTWQLITADGKKLAGGKLKTKSVPTGNVHQIGTVKAPLASIIEAVKAKLTVSLAGTSYNNSWDLFFCPAKVSVDVPSEVVVVRELDDAAKKALANGGKVLLLIDPKKVSGDRRPTHRKANDKDIQVAMGFSPMFWNVAWTYWQPPHTLGLLMKHDHPLFKKFPTDYHSNWQWWDLVHNGGAMILENMPLDLKPIVQVIDNYYTNRKLGLAFEARVGKGKLFVCSIDLDTDLDQRPVARQFRHSILQYMAGKEFAPVTKLSVEDVISLGSYGSSK